jgi:hypothetical protein
VRSQEPTTPFSFDTQASSLYTPYHQNWAFFTHYLDIPYRSHPFANNNMAGSPLTLSTTFLSHLR